MNSRSSNRSSDSLVSGGDEEKKEDANSSEAIAKRLREKIRLQAESLLSRCDTVDRSRQSSRQTSRQPSRDTSPGGGGGNGSTTGGSQPSPLSSVPHTPTLQDILEREKDGTTTTTPAPTTSTIVTPGTDGSNASNNSSTNELTKRLQQLAMQRNNILSSSADRLRVIQSDNTSHLSSIKTFAELQLPSHLLNAVYQMGFDRPSAIQEEALPRILAGRNLIGQAQSGSGKTAAFTIGMLVRTDTTKNTTQALCVTPTRELAIQIVQKAVEPMSVNMEPPLRIQLAISQSDKPSSSCCPHLIVGTPGKVVDWLKRRYISTTALRVFCLDEADTMVEAGSGHRANSLLIQKQLPKSTQCLFFSATYSAAVIAFATKMIPNADKILIEDGPEYLVLDVIKQLWVDTRSYQGGKLEFLADIYSLLTIGQSIVFVGRKDEADAVHTTLRQAGYTCSVLHGAVEAAQRDAVMESFRNGESNVLITTNVLARGVDVDNVCLVVNYDVPVTKDDLPDYETYLHRIGRTGRFGRKGTAINLIADQKSIDVLLAIERHFAKDGKEMIQQAAADPEALADMIEI